MRVLLAIVIIFHYLCGVIRKIGNNCLLQKTNSNKINIMVGNFGKHYRHLLHGMRGIVAAVAIMTLLNACDRSAPSMEADWGQAMWIGLETPQELHHDKDGHACLPARYIHRDFELQGTIKEAVLHVAAGGYVNIKINGGLVTGEVFGPHSSDYDKTVYTRCYDITTLLSEGVNSIDICLTSGWFTGMLHDYGMSDWGEPRLQAQIVARGLNRVIRLGTDTTWLVSDRGPIRLSSIYDGETYDARYEDSLVWRTPDIMEAPKGVKRVQSDAGQSVLGTIRAVRVWRTADGSQIVDMGENMVGWLSLRGYGKAGGEVVISMGETLLPDSSGVYRDNLRDARATNRYIPKTDGRFCYCPSTVWQGFRYAHITGLVQELTLNDVCGYLIADKMEETGTFECSDSLLNSIYAAARRGIRGNYHSFPTDCPQRDERLGWLGDRFTGCIGESYLFDNSPLYLKWLQDIEDSQTEEGQLSDIAPKYWGIRRHDNITWTGAYIAVADMLLERYGSEDGVRLHYESMRRWLLYSIGKGMKDSLMTIDTYGDWCMPPESAELIHSKAPERQTEAAVLSTVTMYGILQTMQKFAALMGRDSDRVEYQRLAAGMKRAYNGRFWHEDTGGYSNQTVTANVISLAQGLVPDGRENQVMEHIVRVTEEDFDSHVSCGVIGIQHLMRTLTRRGYAGLALKLATQTTYPSWGYMLQNGATTVWELWNGNTAAPWMNSGNHVMLIGDLLIWMYEDLAGIRPDERGYRHLLMQPCFPQGLDWVKASYNSVSGRIESEWHREDGRITWRIKLPKAVKATVILPDGTTKEIKGRTKLTFK